MAGLANELTLAETQEVEDIMLAERMGWTLDYIEDMDAIKRLRALTVLDAVDRGRAFRNRPK